jgi:hypothetical protein
VKLPPGRVAQAVVHAGTIAHTLDLAVRRQERP